MKKTEVLSDEKAELSNVFSFWSLEYVIIEPCLLRLLPPFLPFEVLLLLFFISRFSSGIELCVGTSKSNVYLWFHLLCCALIRPLRLPRRSVLTTAIIWIVSFSKETVPCASYPTFFRWTKQHKINNYAINGSAGMMSVIYWIEYVFVQRFSFSRLGKSPQN